MLKFIFLSALILIVSASQAANLKGLEAKLDVFVKELQPVENTGIAVGVVHGGKLVFFKGYGYRDQAKQLPVTEETLFRIGSNTKSFVATNLAMLFEKKLLDLNDPVQKFIPEFQLSDKQVAKEASTVDLLSHRVGLPRHDVLWYMTPFSRGELIDRLQYLEMNKKPGQGFRMTMQYNNLMYMVLGQLTENVSGLSWEESITENILNPLEMNNTNFSVDEMQRQENHAKPYAATYNLPFKQYDAMSSAGVMNSNVNDLAKWVSFQLSKGKAKEGIQLLSETMQERMFQEHSETKNDNVKYGLGWVLSTIGQKKLIWHNGNIDGFSALISFVPEEDLGLIILVNQPDSPLLQFPIELEAKGKKIKPMPVLIYEHLLNIKSAVPSEEKQAKPHFSFPADSFGFDVESKKKIMSELTDIGTEFIGDFSDKGYGTIMLYFDSNRQMWMNYYQGNDWLLEPTSTPDIYKVTPTIFGIKSSESILVELVRSGNKITAILVPFEPEVSPIRFQ